MSAVVDGSAWAESWQRSWDRQQEGYMPDREARLAALVDIVEAVGGPAPRVLDLACGTGSISRRLLDRLPDARSVAVDVDPALLAIARATFAGDERVKLVRADLADPRWVGIVGAGGFDAVVSATALHWLAEPVLRRVYRDLHGLVRPGGVVANADEMAPDELPVLSGALAALVRRRCAALLADGRPDWDTWWDIAATDPALADPVAERRRFFGGDHADEFAPPAGWHLGALVDAGFSEAGVAWRSGGGAVVAAVR